MDAWTHTRQTRKTRHIAMVHAMGKVGEPVSLVGELEPLLL